MTPVISIVTPTLNQGRYIGDTISSVFSQAGNFELEYFIFDGGSTDSTLEIISRYSRLYNTGRLPIHCRKLSFWWCSGRDGGQAEAIVQGFNLSSGSIFNWLNSDDLYSSPRTLDRVLAAFKRNPLADIITGNIRHVDAAGKFLDSRRNIYGITKGFFPDPAIRRVLRHSVLPQPGTFFRRRVYEYCDLDVSLQYSMDWDLWIKAYSQGFRFYKLNSFLADERIQPLAKTVARKDYMYREFLTVYGKHHLWPRERLAITRRVLKSHIHL